MVVWGGGRSGWATPPGLAVLLLVLLWAGSVSPAPFKEDWPESWPEATDLAFPETGKSKHKYCLNMYAYNVRNYDCRNLGIVWWQKSTKVMFEENPPIVKQSV